MNFICHFDWRLKLKSIQALLTCFNDFRPLLVYKLKQASVLGAVVVLINLLFPDAIPYHFFDAWKTHGTTLWEALQFSWPLFVWAAGFTGTVALVTRNSKTTNLYAEEDLKEGLVISLIAGITEEIEFRWLMFYIAIAATQLINGLFFGWWWFHFGVPEWFYVNVLGPVVNCATVGLIHDILFSPLGWFIGSAVLVTNKNFRNGHAYLGIIGFVNSWYIGFYWFAVMFGYGLFAAIVVHILYDALIFVIGYIDKVIERRQDTAKEVTNRR